MWIREWVTVLQQKDIQLSLISKSSSKPVILFSNGVRNAARKRAARTLARPRQGRIPRIPTVHDNVVFVPRLGTFAVKHVHYRPIECLK